MMQAEDISAWERTRGILMMHLSPVQADDNSRDVFGEGRSGVDVVQVGGPCEGWAGHVAHVGGPCGACFTPRCCLCCC